MNQRQIEIPAELDIRELFGSFDANVKLLEKALGVQITCRENVLKLMGAEENIDKFTGGYIVVDNKTVTVTYNDNENNILKEEKFSLKTGEKV